MKQNITQFYKQTKKQRTSTKLYLSNKLRTYPLSAMNSQQNQPLAKTLSQTIALQWPQQNLSQQSLPPNLSCKISLSNPYLKSLSNPYLQKSLSPEQNTSFYIASEGMSNWRQLRLDEGAGSAPIINEADQSAAWGEFRKQYPETHTCKYTNYNT